MDYYQWQHIACCALGRYLIASSEDLSEREQQSYALLISKAYAVYHREHGRRHPFDRQVVVVQQCNEQAEDCGSEPKEPE